MKLRGALLLVVAATVCALSGLLTPQEAAASVDVVNQWPAKPTIASNGTAAAVSGTYAVGSGVNRVMLVAVAAKCTTAPSAISVSYGGQSLGTAVVSNTAQANKIWLFKLNDAGIVAAGANKTLSVSLTGAGTITSIYASASVYSGVNQTTPITGSGANSKTATGTTLALSIPLTANAGLTGNAGMAVYVANWDGATTSTPAAGYTEVRDYQGVNSSLAYCYKVTTGTTTEAPTSTGAAAVVAAAAGVSLNPVTNSGANYATVTTCGDCHGNPPDDGTARNTPPGLFPGAHGKHSGSNEGQYGQACTVCHKNNGTNLAHADGFKNITGTGVPRNTYGGTTNVAMTDVTYAETCTKSTCHSSGRTTKQYAASPVWSGTTTCLSCHGGRSATNPYPAARSTSNFSMSTSHSQHLKYLSTEINCQTCHGKTAASHTALKDYTGAIRHANGTKNVLFTNIAYGSYTSYKSTASGSSANTKVCTNTSCHGGSTRGAWTESTAINSNHTCTHCHGVTTGVSASLAVTGTNRYNLRYFAPGWGAGATKGTSTDQTASSTNIRVGSHFKHLSSAYMRNIKCNECHKVPSTPFSADTNHTLNTTRFNSGTLDFTQASSARIAIGVAAGSTPTQLAAFAGYTNGTATKAATCSSVYCHGSRLKNGAAGGTYLKPYWNYSAMITYGTPDTACGRCHGNPPTSVSASHNLVTPTTGCVTCHNTVVDASGKIINKLLHINGQVDGGGGHEFPYAGSVHKSLAAPITNCTGCHTNGTNTTYPVTAGVKPDCRGCHKANPGTGCNSCHGDASTGRPSNNAAVGNVFPNISGSHGLHVVVKGFACSRCHANGGTGSANHGSSNRVASTGITFVHLTSTTAEFHFTPTGKGTCTNVACHGDAEWGVTKFNCLSCHTNVAGTGTMKRAPVVGQFASQSHHIQKAGGVTNADCYQCHTEADSNGFTTASHGGSNTPGAAVDLVIHGTGSRTVGVSYVAYTANSKASVEATRLSRNRTQMAKINTHCLSCHNAANVAYQPFGDGKTPIAYAWDAKSAGEKYIQTGTTAWGKFTFAAGADGRFGTNAKSAMTKALSAHGNAANNAMTGPTQTDTNSVNVSGSVNVLCFDCHNSHGSTIIGVTSQYSSATGRNKGGILKDIVANTGGYTAAYKPAAHTASGNDKSTFAAGATLCFDCHSNPTAGVAPKTGYTASGTLPWGYNSTYGATQPLIGYLDTPYFGYTTMPVAVRTAYKRGTAGAKKAPMGGHYGVTSALTTTVTKQSHSTTVSSGIVGLCTPCHDPHGVSNNATRIATPANAVPLLKGTWVTSPYKEDLADIAVQRGGGSRYAGLSNGGAIPGYHIDQNTLVATPAATGSGGATTASAKSALRGQRFAPFTNSANTQQTQTDFAGLCIQCHLQASLTNNTVAPSSTNWKTSARIHQSVKGWASTVAGSSNLGNTKHAYTCSKCHAPHVSRLPRLATTNCLDVNHFRQAITGGTIPTAAGTAVPGNLSKPVNTGGVGRFPTGGSLTSNTTAWPSAYNPGPWWWQQTLVNGTITYATNCHNAATAGGTAYNPTNQQWNTKTPW